MEYSHGLCERLIAHFTFAPGDIPPGFSGFREKEGLSLAEFRSFLGNEEFRAAAEEAEERYLDTLTAGALLKKYDATFVRHLLEAAAKRREGSAAPPLTVEIRVVE